MSCAARRRSCHRRMRFSWPRQPRLVCQLQGSSGGGGLVLLRVAMPRDSLQHAETTFPNHPGGCLDRLSLADVTRNERRAARDWRELERRRESWKALKI